jgi:ABC-type lipoprotein export system ATPase subunit
VTHEADIAAYARRNVVMRDGQILSDRAVARRATAATELEKLSALPEDPGLGRVAEHPPQA